MITEKTTTMQYTVTSYKKNRSISKWIWDWLE